MTKPIDYGKSKIKASGFIGPITVSSVESLSPLGGTLTGVTDGALADVAAIALDTSDTYSDSAVNTAVNTAITSINLQLKELQKAYNDLLAALKA